MPRKRKVVRKKRHGSVADIVSPVRSGISLTTVLLVAGQSGTDGLGNSRGMIFDGTNWSIINDTDQSEIPPYNYPDWGQSAFYDGINLLIGCGKDIIGSTDGTTWTPYTSPFPIVGNSVSGVAGLAKKGSQYIAAGWQNESPWRIFGYGSLGSWSLASSPVHEGESGAYTNDVQSNGSIFVACGRDAWSQYSIFTSSDGITWTARHTPWDGGSAQKACWSPQLGLWVACGNGNNAVLATSASDGSSWTQVMTGSISGGDIAWSPDLGLFCYCAGSAWGGHTVHTSPDGTNWTHQSGGDVLDTRGVTGVCWSPKMQKFYAANQSNSVWQSSDGISWERALAQGTFTAQDIYAVQ